MPEPLVSIVIPVYNRASLLEKAIRSALAQTYRNIEVIVCDNCSTDGTFEIVQKYMRQDSRVTGYRNSENLGLVKNWIRGIELSHGEYIRLLFSDDWIEPESVERMLVPMLKEPQVGFCSSAVEINEQDRHLPVYQLRTEGRLDSMEFLHLLLSGTCMVPVSPGCGMFRRDDARQFIPEQLPAYKGYDVNRRGIGNDVMLYLRTCERYPHCFYISTPLTHFLSHPGSFSVDVSTNTPFRLEWCYIHSFAHFLERATLVPSARLRLSWDLKYYIARLRVLGILTTMARNMRRWWRNA